MATQTRRVASKPVPAKVAAAKRRYAQGGGGLIDSLRPKAVARPGGATKAPAATPDGRQPQARRTPASFVPGTVFVVMSFNGVGMDESFAAIKAACRGLKLAAHRADEIKTSGFIILEVIDQIEKAEFIVVDLTHERPNVYYELGYAHGVGNAPDNILLVAHDSAELHFDISAFRVRRYKSADELRKIVRTTLKSMVLQTRPGIAK